MPCAPFALEERGVVHAEDLFQAIRDANLYEFLDEDPPGSVAELAAKLARSESRLSPDGKEHWLNWVIRMGSGALAGYVQATIEETKDVNIAYVVAQEFQGRGVASAAVRQMLEIVITRYEVKNLFITAEAANLRSLRLAERLGFAPAPSEVALARKPGPSDIVYWKSAASSEA